MTTRFDALRTIATNALPERIPPFVTGIIGDRPSQYAKTPLLWNAAYRELGWDAVSLSWDLETDERLPGFLDAARGCPEIAGFSVTQPFKISIVPLLDRLDPLARDIGAVNTVARHPDGTLVGYNTDGQGAIDALVAALPGMDRPFLPSIGGRRVMMIGAGGAARAVAFYVASRLGANGRLRIVNRDESKAVALAAAVKNAHGVGEGGGEDALPSWIGDVDLVINASVKGQAGWRRCSDGSAFALEPYSALGSANPSAVPAARELDAAAARAWFAASRRDIAANQAAAGEMIAAMTPDAACFDLVYAPLETRFLADARLSGHATLNGKWMNIAQAADAFARRVCPPELARRGMTEDEGYRTTFAIMTRVW